MSAKLSTIIAWNSFLQWYTCPCFFSVIVITEKSYFNIFLILLNPNISYAIFTYFYRLGQQTITSIITIWEILAVQSMFSVGTEKLFHTWNFCLMMNLHLHQLIVRCGYGMWRKTCQWVIYAKWFHAFVWLLSCQI